MSRGQRPAAAFILSFAGGALIFANGLVFTLASRAISKALEYVVVVRGLQIGVALAIQQMLISLSAVGLVLGALIDLCLSDALLYA